MDHEEISDVDLGPGDFIDLTQGELSGYSPKELAFYFTNGYMKKGKTAIDAHSLNTKRVIVAEYLGTTPPEFQEKFGRYLRFRRHLDAKLKKDLYDVTRRDAEEMFV